MRITTGATSVTGRLQAAKEKLTKKPKIIGKRCVWKDHRNSRTMLCENSNFAAFSLFSHDKLKKHYHRLVGGTEAQRDRRDWTLVAPPESINLNTM
eukprot:gene9203-biopygen15048